MSPAAPSLPPLVCISNINWDFLWQRHQILMSGLAARGIKVAFVEKMDAGRTIQVHDWPRVVARLGDLARQLRRGHRVEQGVHVLTPMVVPWGAVALANRRIVLPRLARRLARLGFARPIVWTYSSGPNSTTLERLLEPRLLVFDCVNRIRGYAYASSDLIRAEESLVRRADVVIADSTILYEESRAINPRCEQLLPGVDFDLFAPQGQPPRPSVMAALPRPRLGFFGAIDERLDRDALVRFAADHAGWSVVLIGPVQGSLGALTAAPNVHLLGSVPYRELGAWLQELDVIAVPYRSTEFTRGIVPAKLFEMLATGKPVVAMGLPELRPYAQEIRLCDAEGFSAAVERAAAEDTPESRAGRMALARANSWAGRVEQAYGLLAEAWVAKAERAVVTGSAGDS